jgi:hypothetical protein
MIELTEEQRRAVMSGETVRIQAAEIGKNVVLLLEEEYEKLRQLLLEEQEDRKLQEAWQKLAYRGLALSLDDEP